MSALATLFSDKPVTVVNTDVPETFQQRSNRVFAATNTPLRHGDGRPVTLQEGKKSVILQLQTPTDFTFDTFVQLLTNLITASGEQGAAALGSLDLSIETVLEFPAQTEPAQLVGSIGLKLVDPNAQIAAETILNNLHKG